MIKKFFTDTLNGLKQDILGMRDAFATRKEVSPDAAALQTQFDAIGKLENPADRLLAYDDFLRHNRTQAHARAQKYQPPRLLLQTLGLAVAAGGAIALALPVALAQLAGVTVLLWAGTLLGLSMAVVMDATIQARDKIDPVLDGAVAAARGGDVLEMARSNNFDEVARRFPAIKEAFMFAATRASITTVYAQQRYGAEAMAKASAPPQTP